MAQNKTCAVILKMEIHEPRLIFFDADFYDFCCSEGASGGVCSCLSRPCKVWQTLQGLDAWA